jgi:hypothetical protein
MLRGLIVSGIAVFGLVLFLDSDSQGGDKKPASIKVVMQKAMKGGLCGKVASGKASDDEKKQLVALFTDLAAAKCPKGEEADWKARTTALLEAAKSGDGKALKKAADCKGCHSTHK